MRRLCADQDLKDFFRDGKPHRIEDIKDRFNVKKIVAYREMKRIKALRSINATGYFILPWRAPSTQDEFVKIEGKVFFSGGDLSEALIYLITKSRAGLTAKDLERKVGTNPRVQLLNLIQKHRVYREKFGGSYIYFSHDKEQRKRQLEPRQAKYKKKSSPPISDPLETLPLELIIKILLTFIRHPDFSPKSAALSLVRRGEKITSAMVESVFLKYELYKKKF